MKDKTNIILIVFIVVLAGIIFTLIYLMHGSTITNDNDTASIKTNALNCESNTTDYPIFAYDNSSSKKVKINLIFSENALKTVAMDYLLSYNNESEIIASEAHNHAAMNLNFYANGLNSDEFSAKYTKLVNGMRMNLYAKGTDINKTTAKYFLIELDDNENVPENLSGYKMNYEKQGFNCKTNE